MESTTEPTVLESLQKFIDGLGTVSGVNMSIYIATILLFIFCLVYISSSSNKETAIYKFIKFVAAFIWERIFLKYVPGLKSFAEQRKLEEYSRGTQASVSVKSEVDIENDQLKDKFRSKDFVFELQKCYDDSNKIKELIKSTVPDIDINKVTVNYQRFDGGLIKASVGFELNKSTTYRVFIDYNNQTLFSQDKLDAVEVVYSKSVTS